MAETTGLVQKLTVMADSAVAWAWIGPTPTNTELLAVIRDSTQTAEAGAFHSSMVDALTAAAAARREVVAIHGDTDGRITSLRFDSA